MTNNRKGPLSPFLIFSLLALSLLTLSRLSLAVWQADRVSDADGWLTILIQGLRVDIATLCWLLILPAMLATLLPQAGIFGKIWRFVLRVWLVGGLWLMVYMELATPPFIIEYDLRPNRLFVEYLIYPKEVFSMLWVGYKLELAIGLIGSLLTLFLGWKFSGYAVKRMSVTKWYWRPLMALLVVVVGVMGARSSLGHRPLNPSMVAFSSDPLVNDLTLNSSYSLFFAIKNMSSEKSATKFYGTMPEQEIIDLVRQSSGKTGEFISEEYPTLNVNEPSYTGKKKNLVILLQESLGARFVGSLGGLPLTPNLDELMKEGWNFTQMYATGTRSVRGIEAITTGFSPTPSRAVVKLSKSQTNFFTIAELLGQQNYHTQFIYGGESHFDNMKSFFLGNGFQNIIDENDYENPVFKGSWGASDEDLYNMAHKQFTQLSKSDKPFFSLVFSSSNHSPFEYPDGRIQQYDADKQTRHNAVKYADYALGEFFKKVKQSDYWDNTIFIVIADHDASVHSTKPVPVNRFHIPALILGKDILPRQDNRIVNNSDMPVTLMSLIGVRSVSPMLGHDMTKPLAPEFERAMMQFDKNFGYLTRNKLVILSPEKQPSGYRYNFDTKEITPEEATDMQKSVAKANALWGSIAYNKGLYRMPDAENVARILQERDNSLTAQTNTEED
ncbi:LTA synthase family protein [Photobacterium sp. J15]|uniref:LTA synthase family protein n=1 Tax=Photobacterium sp. J15 TaxID=265901 RepID=UPI000A025036|nr:LTA synthase family protein [Photobacterium sp. J15]